MASKFHGPILQLRGNFILKNNKQLTYKYKILNDMKIRRPFKYLMVIPFIIYSITCKKLDIIELTKIKTGTINNLSINSATVTSTFVDVGENIYEYGHCWGTNTNPTIDDEKDLKVSSPPKGEFSSNLINLLPNTSYYVRPYAKEEDAVKYGESVQFTTNPLVYDNLYVFGAATDAGWTAADAIPMIKYSDKKFRGFVHLTKNSGGIKFLGELNKDIEWGINPENDKELSLMSNKLAIPPPIAEGFYLIEVNFNDLSYRITRVIWGMIGTAVHPHDWSVDKPMTYIAPYTWKLDVTLIDGIFKFRANNNWGNNDYEQALNLGDNLADGSLEHGGLDILVSTGGYTITLKIHPTDGYTYTMTLNSNVPNIITTFAESHWEMGTTHDITWYDNISENVYIQLFKSDSYLRDIAINISNTGNYSWSIPTDLEEGSDYKIKVASVSNIEVMDLSNTFQLSSASGTTGTVTDYDANTYNSVKIGLQWWMAENLKTTHYSDGTAIPLVTDSLIWAALGDNNTDKAYCYYENYIANADAYGNLYTWSSAMNGATGSDANPSGVMGICPVGWHLPSDSEWKELETYLGMNQVDLNLNTEFRGSDEGGKLKETGTVHWSSPNMGATNEKGFTALPGGRRMDGSTGAFDRINLYTYFWSATNSNETDSWCRKLSYDISNIGRFDNGKSYGYSVRCIKDF